MMNDPNTMRDAMLGRMNAAQSRPIDTSRLGPVRFVTDEMSMQDAIMIARKAIYAKGNIALCERRMIACNPGGEDDARAYNRLAAWRA